MTPRRDHSRTVLRRLVVAPGGGPASRERNHGRFVLRPVVQGGGVEIGAVRPHEGVDFTVERDGIELTPSPSGQDVPCISPIEGARAVCRPARIAGSAPSAGTPLAARPG
jgi:hypothetical protein